MDKEALSSGYFSHDLEKMPDKKHFKEEKVYSPLQLAILV